MVTINNGGDVLWGLYLRFPRCGDAGEGFGTNNGVKDFVAYYEQFLICVQKGMRQSEDST